MTRTTALFSSVLFIAMAAAAADIALSPARPFVPQAAVVRVGPETPASPITMEAAAGTQNAPRLAVNGSDYVSVWYDERRSPWETPALYGTRIEGDGKPAEAYGHLVAPFFYGLLACNGSSCLVAGWAYTLSGNAAAFVQPIDRDANPIGSPQPVAGLAPREIASNGSSFLLVSEAENFSSTVTLLDAAGHTLHTSSAPLWVAKNGIAVRDGAYVVLGWDTTECQPFARCRGSIALMNVDSAGTITSQRAIGPSGVVGGRLLAAAFKDDGMLTAWSRDLSTSEPTTAGFTLFDREGNLIGGQHVLSQVTAAFPDDFLNVAITGNEFLFTFRIDNDFSVGAMRVKSDGTLIDTEPFVFARGPAYAPVAASLPDSTLLLWPEQRFETFDIFSQVVRSFDELPAHEQFGTLISEAAPAQMDMDVASEDGQRFVVWAETGTTHRVMASTGGTPLTIATLASPGWFRPVATRGANSYLVVWPDFTDGTLMAARVALDGKSVLGDPIVIEGSMIGWFVGAAMCDVASNGSEFLIVWTNGGVKGRRLDESGRLLEDAPFDILTESQSESLDSPAVVASADGFIVAASGHVRSYLGSPPPPPATRIWAASVKNGSRLTVPSVPIVDEQSFTGYSLESVALTWAGDRATIVWKDTEPRPEGLARCVSAVQVSSAGMTVTSARQLHCSTSAASSSLRYFPSVDITWSGSEHFIVWTEAGSERVQALAMRFDLELKPLDESPVQVSPEAANTFPVYVSRSPEGVTVAYVHVDPAAGDVPRIFTRAVAWSANPPRRRATSH